MSQPTPELPGPSSAPEDESAPVDADMCMVSQIYEKFAETSQTCTTEVEQNTTHISSLPIEMLWKIMEHVVEPEFDDNMKSLQSLGSVSRGFYVCAQDSLLWKQACQREWQAKCGDSVGIYKSWKHMYMERPRTSFEGFCMADNYLNKKRKVKGNYCRLLRFELDGSVMMASFPLRGSNIPLPEENVTNISQLKGQYTFCAKEKKIIVVFETEQENAPEWSYRMELKANRIYRLSIKLRESVLCTWVPTEAGHPVIREYFLRSYGNKKFMNMNIW